MRVEAAVPPEVLAAMRAPFAALAATPLDAPIAQPLGLTLDLAGEGLRERLFLVQGAGTEEACLRPDFTLAAVRAHIASGAVSGRYSYEGPAFSVAPAGSDRAEQYPQIGLEAFESGDAAQADAAMADLAWRSASAGGRTDLTLVFGDVALFGAVLSALGVAEPLALRLRRAVASPGRLRRELTSAMGETALERPERQRLTHLLAGLSERDAAGVLEEVWNLAGVEPVGGRSAADIARRLLARAALEAAPRLTVHQGDRILRFLAIDDTPLAALKAVKALGGDGGEALAGALAAWEHRLAALERAGVPADRTRLSTALGQTFSYYDGMVFVINGAALPEDQAIAAGGRYDSLAARLGTPLATGAVGCMVRPGRAWRGARP